MKRRCGAHFRASVITLAFIALCGIMFPYNAFADNDPYTITPLDLKLDSELPTVSYNYGDQPFYFNPSGLNNSGQVSGNYEMAVWGNYQGNAPYLRDSDGEMIFIDTGFTSVPGRAARIDDEGHVLVNNLNQQIAGTIQNGMAAWKNGSFSSINLPSVYNNVAFDLNESGLVIGKRYANGWVVDRFTGDFHEITPFNWYSGRYTTVDAINSSGKVVGSSPIYLLPPPFGYATPSTHGYIWDAVNGKTDLGSLGGGYQWSWAYGINDRDEVVGTSNTGEKLQIENYQYAVSRAFLWDSGAMTDLGSLEGYQFSEALGINNKGQVIGIAKKLWMDSYGNVIGTWDGFLWQNGSIASLESLLPEGHGWNGMLPVAINDHGVIVGEGYYGLTRRGFIMSPPGGNLAVTLDDSPDPLILGERLTWFLDVFNYGPNGATGVRTIDVLPADTYYISSTANCLESDGAVTCDLGSLAAGAGASLAIEVEPMTAGTLVNTVTVSGNEADPDPSNNSALEETRLLTHAEAVRHLQQMILGYNLQQGINNSLDAKLDAVVRALEAINAGQRQDAANKLDAFANEVEAQRGLKITDEQADELVGFASRIIAVM